MSENENHSTNHNANRDQDLLRFAREERKFANEFSQEMWSWLRNRQCRDQKFRREYAIPPYIADFCCVELKLIIEVDGESHFTVEGREHDRKRDQFLAARGFEVLRIPGYQVLKRPGEVIKKIENAIDRLIEESKNPTPPPILELPQPPPRPLGGEGAGG